MATSDSKPLALLPDGDIKFFVAGLPKPGGSKKAFVIPGTTRAVVTEASKNKDWKRAVSQSAALAMGERPFFSCPLAVTTIFIMPRPKGHYGTGKNAGKLKLTAPLAHTSKPDVTKLMRSTEDAMTFIVWKDDAANVVASQAKIYGEKPGVFVWIRPLDQQELIEKVLAWENRGATWPV